MAPPMSARKSQGRQKIDIKLIDNESARTTTFSKRKVGVFKKATELSTLCAAQIVVIVFSICGKVFTFGHPSLESVLHKLQNGNSMPCIRNSVHASKLNQGRVKDLKSKWDELNEKVDGWKRKRKELNEKIESSSFEISEEKLNKLSLEELKIVKEKLARLHEFLSHRANGDMADLNNANVGLENTEIYDLNNENVSLENIEIEDGEKVNWLKL